jgi:hypothetical protein
VVVVGARRAGMVAVVLAALTMGLAFAHTRELPQKLAYEAATWTQLQHGLYRYFAMVGGPAGGGDRHRRCGVRAAGPCRLSSTLRAWAAGCLERRTGTRPRTCVPWLLWRCL